MARLYEISVGHFAGVSCLFTRTVILFKIRSYFHLIKILFNSLKAHDAITSEIKHQVHQNPISVAHIPEALHYLITTEAILNDSPKLVYMLTWTRISPIEVSFF